MKTFFPLSVFVLCSLCSFAQELPKRTLLALSKSEHTLSVIDPQTLNILATIPVGPNPHEVIASSDGTIAYVSNPGNSDLYEIDVIDLVHQKPLPMIDTRPLYGPHGLSYVDDKLWFTAQGSKAVGRATEKLEWAMGTGQDVTHMIYVKPDASAYYTTNAQSATVSIVEHKLIDPIVPPTGKLPPNAKAHWGWVQTLIPTSLGAEGFDVTKVGKELWTVDDKGLISIINIEKKALIAQVESGNLGAHRLKFTPDGKWAAMISVRTGELLFYDVEKRKPSHNIKIAQGATMLMDEEDNRLFISCPIDGYITIIDLTKMEVEDTLNVGGRPDGLAWAVR